MSRRGSTIARGMGWIAVIALNAGLVRAFLVQEMFCGVILLLFAMQVGLWRLLGTRGRIRGFWAGFVASGASAFLAMVLCEVLPGSILDHLLLSYTMAAMEWALNGLPAPIADYLDAHQDQLVTAIDFLPELALCLVGGWIGAWILPRAALSKTSRTPLCPPFSRGEGDHSPP
jgi:hypothetical protein